MQRQTDQLQFLVCCAGFRLRLHRRGRPAHCGGCQEAPEARSPHPASGSAGELQLQHAQTGLRCQQQPCLSTPAAPRHRSTASPSSMAPTSSSAPGCCLTLRPSHPTPGSQTTLRQTCDHHHQPSTVAPNLAPHHHQVPAPGPPWRTPSPFLPLTSTPPTPPQPSSQLSRRCSLQSPHQACSTRSPSGLSWRWTRPPHSAAAPMSHARQDPARHGSRCASHACMHTAGVRACQGVPVAVASAWLA